MFEIGDIVRVSKKYLYMYSDYKDKKMRVIRKSDLHERKDGSNKPNSYLYVLEDAKGRLSCPFFEKEIERA